MDPTVSGKKKINVAAMAKIGMLSGLAVVLMLFEIPLWFAPGFYKMDLSEVVVAIGAFSMGPVAGIIIEAIKVLQMCIRDRDKVVLVILSFGLHCRRGRKSVAAEVQQ